MLCRHWLVVATREDGYNPIIAKLPHYILGWKTAIMAASALVQRTWET